MAVSPLSRCFGCCRNTSTKLLIVITTGLSLLQPTIVHDRRAYLALTGNQLDGSNFDPAAIDCRPFLSHYAAVACHKDYEYAIIDRHIYQVPNLSGYLYDAKLEGIVNTFQTDLSY